MKLSTIQEAINAEIDEPVLAIRGKLTKLFERFSGESQYGVWTLQNGQLADDEGTVIKLQLSNREEMPQAWRNQTIEIRCGKGAKGSGYTGVKRIADKKDKSPVLQLSDKAEVFLFKSEHQPETEELPKQPQTAAPNGAPKASGSPPAASQAPKSNIIPAADEFAPEPPPAPKGATAQMAQGMSQMYQIANTQYAAIRMVHEYLVPSLQKHGITVDPQQEAALVQNMLIQMYYQRGHHNFPSTRFIKAEPPKEPTPEDLDQSGPEQPF